MNKRIVLLLLLLVLPVQVDAQQQVTGDWQGLLQIGPAQLQLVLHLTGDAATGYRATLDSPDQNVQGMTVETISFEDSKLTFTLPQIGGSYEGALNDGGGIIVGLWSQSGASLPLELERVAGAQAAPARVPRPGEMDGTWNGALSAQGQSIELILRITTYEDGLGGTLDVPAQNASGLPVTRLTRDNDRIRLEMRQLAAIFEATLDSEGSTISGTWRQGDFESPLVLRKSAGP